MRSLLIRLFLALLAALPPAALAASLRWATQADIQTLDPHAQNDLLTNSLSAHVHERLTARDERLTIVPALATGWRQLGPRRWRFELRPGVRFHGGEPFTADDVVFSVERAQHPNSAISHYARALGRVSASGPHAVEFTLERFNPVFLDHLDAVFIMSRAWAASHGLLTPPRRGDAKASAGATAANGTGPFQLVERVPDARTVLRRRADHWAGPQGGNVEQLIHLPVASAAARSAGLLSGELDLVTDPAPADIARLAQGARFRIARVVENRVYFLGFKQNLDRLASNPALAGNPLRDPRVRQAIALAIDTQALSARLLQGNAVPARCLMPAASACDAVMPPLPMRAPDREQARALMAQAGYPRGFALTFHCPQPFEPSCQAITVMLAKIGIRAQLVPEPLATFYARLHRRETDFYFLGWGGAESDPQPTLDPLMHSPNGITGQGQVNYGGIEDAALDALIDAAAREEDPAARRRLLDQAITRHETRLYHVPLYRPTLSWAMRRGVTAEPLPNGRLRAWAVKVENPGFRSP